MLNALQVCWHWGHHTEEKKVNTLSLSGFSTWLDWDKVSLTHPVYSAHTHRHAQIHAGLTWVNSADVTPWTRSPSENWLLSLCFSHLHFFLSLPRPLWCYISTSLPTAECFPFVSALPFCLFTTFLCCYIPCLTCSIFFPHSPLSLCLAPSLHWFLLLSFSSCTCPVAFYLNSLSLHACLRCHPAMRFDCDSGYHQILTGCVMQEAKGACFCKIVWVRVWEPVALVVPCLGKNQTCVFRCGWMCLGQPFVFKRRAFVWACVCWMDFFFFGLAEERPPCLCFKLYKR